MLLIPKDFSYTLLKGISKLILKEDLMYKLMTAICVALCFSMVGTVTYIGSNVAAYETPKTETVVLGHRVAADGNTYILTASGWGNN